MGRGGFGAGGMARLLGAIGLGALAVFLLLQSAGEGPSAVAQNTCGIPLPTIERRAEGFRIEFTYPSGVTVDPTNYQYQYALSTESYGGTWTTVTGTTGFTSARRWEASTEKSGLLALTEYKVKARSQCGSDYSAETSDRSITTEKTRTYTVTLTKDGSNIIALDEGQSATVTLTLESASDVYDRDVGVRVVGRPWDGTIGGSFVAGATSREYTVSGVEDFPYNNIGLQRLRSGETSVSWTVRAVQDNVAHDAATNDNEFPLEGVIFTVLLEPANGAIQFTSGAWDRIMAIRDGDQVIQPPPPGANNPAEGTVSIDDTTPELRETLTASVSGVTDADGLTSPTYSYQWLHDGELIAGATGATYVVAVSDIGMMLSAQAQFRDDLDNVETLTSEATIEVPSGPVILASNGYVWVDDPSIVNTISVDTLRMNYTYLSPLAMFAYRWFYVTAEGAPRDYIPGATQSAYTLTSADVGKSIDVEVNFLSTALDAVSVTANEPTPLITERLRLAIPTNARATVSRNGGSVLLVWDLTPGEARPSGFEYRHKATALAGSVFTRWEDGVVRGGTQSVTIRGNHLINGAEYRFEVRSFGPGVAGSAGTTDSVTARYRHRARGC